MLRSNGTRVECTFFVCDYKALHWWEWKKGFVFFFRCVLLIHGIHYWMQMDGFEITEFAWIASEFLRWCHPKGHSCKVYCFGEKRTSLGLLSEDAYLRNRKRIIMTDKDIFFDGSMQLLASERRGAPILQRSNLPQEGGRDKYSWKRLSHVLVFLRDSNFGVLWIGFLLFIFSGAVMLEDIGPVFCLFC